MSQNQISKYDEPTRLPGEMPRSVPDVDGQLPLFPDFPLSQLMPIEVHAMWLVRGLDPESCLCIGCPHNPTCPYIWDLYNHGDSCLADK